VATVKREKNQNIASIMAGLDTDKKAKVGIMGGTYGDGTPVAYVAAIQEFGSPKNNIPPRSFMRSTISEQHKKWIKTFGKAMERMSAEQALELVGAQAAGDVQEMITSIQTPPLSPTTIHARQRKMADGKTVGNLTKPLVETALLLASIKSVVQ